VRRRVLDLEPGFVGELAEVHLVGMRGLREHADVRARAEHLVQAPGDHDGADLGMLEAQALDGVVQLDVHAQVVAVHLQLVARHQPAVLGDVEAQVRHLPLHVELPVPVARRIGVEGDLRFGGRLGGAGHR
jgi:hypothetical protein